MTDVIDDESTVRVNRKRELISVSKGNRGNTMIGICYLLEEEAITIRETVEFLCGDTRYNDSFWEDALFSTNQLSIYAKVFSSHKIVEINSYEQLRELDEHSHSLNTEIISLIASQFNTESKNVKNIDILKKGMTNRSFKFHVGTNQYIMRVPGEGTAQLINRTGEYNVYNAISEYKIGDHVIYISPDTGYKITEYMDNARVCDPYNLREVKLCMNKLRAFHDLKLTVGHSFDLYERIEFYESLWNGNPSVFKDYLETKGRIKTLQDYITSLPKEWCLTHIDAVPDNFLFSNDEIYLIDWEYASMQDPHLDIAMFAIYSMYDRDHVDKLIDAYFIEGCPREIKTKIYAYIAISGLLWSNWCEYKRLCGVEFGEYSLRQYRYAKEYYNIIKEERFYE